jgi:hypothetical protein
MQTRNALRLSGATKCSQKQRGKSLSYDKHNPLTRSFRESTNRIEGIQEARNVVGFSHDLVNNQRMAVSACQMERRLSFLLEKTRTISSDRAIQLTLPSSLRCLLHPLLRYSSKAGPLR